MLLIEELLKRVTMRASSRGRRVPSFGSTHLGLDFERRRQCRDYLALGARHQTFLTILVYFFQLGQ